MTKILLIILTLTVTTVAGTFAYFQNSATVQNNYASGMYSTVVQRTLSDADWLPGTTIPIEELNVKNTGSVDVAVRAWIEESATKEDAPKSLTLPNGEDMVLKKIDTDSWTYDGEKYYYYNEILTMDEQTTDFISELTFNPNASADVKCETIPETGNIHCYGSEEGYDKTVYSIIIHFDTIQTAGLGANWDISLDTVGKALINLDADGGSLENNQIEVTYNRPYGVLPTPTNIQAGYTFIGWFTSDNKEILETSIYTKADGDTLIAKYSTNAYQLVFDSKGGEELTPKNVSYESNYGELPTPTRTGYTFKGWYKDEAYTTEVTEKTSFNEANDITIYAKWEGNPYTVSYNPNGGTLETETQDFIYDATYTDLPIPEYEGYSFGGWYTDTNFITEIKNGDTVKITNNTTLYAKWNVNTYTVNFDTDGGSVEYSKEVTFNTAYGDLPTPKKNGYKFMYWQDESENIITSTSKMDKARNHTLKAIWQAINYKVTFNAQEGTTTGTERTIAYGSKYETLPTASLTGHTFVGWFTEISGGDQITEDSIMDSVDGITLYAHYQAQTFNVYFNANGGSVGTSVITVTYGSYYAETFPTPTKEGHTFLGWYTSVDGDTKVEPSTSVTITETQVLHAHWQADTYKVNIVATNTDVSNTELTVAYGNNVELSITPKSDYSISSVSCDNGYTTTAIVGTSATTTQNITIANNNHTTGSTCTIYSRPINTFYDMMKYQSVADNVQSRYVTSTSGVNLGEISSDTNGKGVYELKKISTSTPIYYYRGDVDNNVIFAGFCWKIIRTTETQGTKLIYNGAPTDGKCEATGDDTTIGKSAFNTTNKGAKYVGYTVDGADSTIKKYIDGWYEGTAKGNMKAHEASLEDTPFYNEKTATTFDGDKSVIAGYPAGIRIWGFTDGNTDNEIYQANVPNTTVILGNGVPKEDIYMMDKEKGNGLLKYPVGLITSDEVVLAGGRGHISGGGDVEDSSSYLRNGKTWWTISPTVLRKNELACVIYLGSKSELYHPFSYNIHVDNAGGGVRPVVSLQPGTGYINNGADGSSSKPFIVLE